MNPLNNERKKKAILVLTFGGQYTYFLLQSSYSNKEKIFPDFARKFYKKFQDTA